MFDMDDEDWNLVELTKITDENFYRVYDGVNIVKSTSTFVPFLWLLVVQLFIQTAQTVDTAPFILSGLIQQITYRYKSAFLNIPPEKCFSTIRRQMEKDTLFIYKYA